ncbi:MAG: glycosyltransferase, partial [Treponema sp.]|nr:glycosyltransferase [Treponema sp.]
MSQIDVSVIIVNFNTKDLLQNCLRSIYEQTANVTIEVLVSDNGSTDGSLEMVRQQFPQTILLENNANLGFGKANNIAAKQAHGKYIFYLNSDTELKNNAIKYFFDYWENATEKNDIGALGCNL